MNPKSIRSGMFFLIVAFFLPLAAAFGIIRTVDAAQGAAPLSTVETGDGYYYTVQKGDTLWDLSRRFSSAPWVWPELWEENSQIIANPHLIYPGQKLRLTRIVGAPPAAAKPSAPAPVPAHAIYYYFSPSDQYGFIRKVPVAPDGVIIKPQDPNTNMISQNDIVYIRPEGGAALSKGQLLTVFRTFDPLYRENARENTKELLGTQHLLCGLIEILERQPLYAIGRVVRSYRPIQVNDKLMPYEHRSHRTEIQESEPGIEGALLFEEERMNMFGEFQIAFIDQGKRQGLKPGQHYSIYKRDEYNFGTLNAPKNAIIPVDYGEVLVLQVEDETSTVLVTKSQKESYAGTRIRTPVAVAMR